MGTTTWTWGSTTTPLSGTMSAPPSRTEDHTQGLSLMVRGCTISGSVEGSHSQTQCRQEAQERLLSRATSVPPSTAAFRGSTGFYARELAKTRASSVERSSSAVIESSSARATRASSVPPTAGFGGHPGYYGQQLAAVAESHESSSAISSSVQTSSTSRLESSITAQELSIKQGRQSSSRAVRRAELHASSSGRDPRHVGVPRDTSDDICYKVADLRMTPFESRELQSHTEANMRGRLRVQKLEKELSALTSSAMKYKSFYAKSAAQMAKEAIEASESEAAASRKVRKTTVVESSRQVAAA